MAQILLLCLLVLANACVGQSVSLPRKIAFEVNDFRIEARSYNQESSTVEPSAKQNGGVEAEEDQRHHSHRHLVDKSVAGGGVILGGLAVTFLVAIFCYIRATGRHRRSECASSVPSSPVIKNENRVSSISASSMTDSSVPSSPITAASIANSSVSSSSPSSVVSSIPSSVTSV